jgi:hypothetical protein
VWQKKLPTSLGNLWLGLSLNNQHMTVNVDDFELVFLFSFISSFQNWDWGCVGLKNCANNFFGLILASQMCCWLLQHSCGCA